MDNLGLIYSPIEVIFNRDGSRKEVLALPANSWIEEESGEVVVVVEDDEGRA